MDREDVAAWIREQLPNHPVEEHDPAAGIPLQVVSYGAQEVEAVLEVLLSTWVTMGKEVAAFEEEWSAWCGTEHAVLCNSGSSANLLALAALQHTGRLAPGDEILVPAVAWSTSLFPVAQLGFVPVLVDVDPDTLCLTPEIVAAARGPRTRGVVAVHLLGHPVASRQIGDQGLVVLDDACAAPGAMRDGEMAGTCGAVGTYSFFFSHHISTIEGGALVMQEEELADAARSLRAHGWIREMRSGAQLAAERPDIDPRFHFSSVGWNLRPTEITGAMGRCQIRRLDEWLDRRRLNHVLWCERLERFSSWLQVFPEEPGTRHAAFAFPMLLAEGLDRASLMAHLESWDIETRPISGSNLARQPAFARISSARVHGSLVVADAVHTRGLFTGNSHAFHEGHGALLVRALEDWNHG
jgi:CDP-6-deoxy-D-xylo-4-hexulose-3-dehydrase